MPTPVTTDDLAQVEDVLARRKTLTQAAVQYTPRVSTLLAVTLLYLSGWKQGTTRGEYGKLLEAIARNPATPEGGPTLAWGDDFEKWPRWYYRKYGSDLVPISRLQNWHMTPVPGGIPRLNPPAELEQLKANAAYCAVARDLLEQVAPGYVASDSEPAAVPDQADPADQSDYALIQRAVQADPGLAWAIPQLLAAAGTATDFVRLYTQYAAKLKAHFPILLPRDE